MENVKWIKITTDMFDNRKIKHLRRLPDGNNIVLIWVMLLTMAGRCNANGMIILTENIPYTTKMLADELGFEESTVKLALEAFEQLNMVVSDAGCFAIAGWAEHQNIEGMEKIKEQTRRRVQKHRENAKLLASNTSDTSCDGNVTCNVTVTQCNATDKEIERDKDIEIREKKLKEKRPTTENTLTLFERLKGDYQLHEAVVDKLREWFKYKTERKEPYKEQGMKALLRRIETSCNQFGKEAVINVIDESMERGWKGIIFDRLTQSQTQPQRNQSYNDAIKNRLSVVDEW